jgi:DNA-binding protein H-NS
MSLEETNAETIDHLSNKVDELVEERRIEETRKERSIEKARENQAEINALMEKVDEIARQTGIDTRKAKDTHDDRTRFFVPASKLQRGDR